MFKLDTKKIALYLTNKCNLRCKHCFIEGSPLNEEFLSLAQIRTALHYFRAQDYSQVEFTGGEPCFSPFLAPAVKLGHKLGYLVGINTNGTNPHILNLFTPKEVDKLTFSLDGAKRSTHDQLRGKGVFDLCLKTIGQAIKLGFYTEAIFTAHQNNYREIPDVIKLLDHIGVNRLSFNFISNKGTATFNQQLLIPPETWQKSKQLIESALPTKHLHLRYPPLFVTPEEFNKVKKTGSYYCRLVNPIKAEVYPDGHIYHCCLVGGTREFSAGRVLDHRVDIDTTNEVEFVKKYRHLSCPVYQIRQLYSSNNRLIPLCLYYKELSPS